MTNEMRVMCPDCGEVVDHHCHEQSRTALQRAVVELLKWVPDGGTHKTVAAALQKAGEKSGWLAKGEDFQKMPFFGGQSWSYALFDKEGGRAFEARINAVLRAAGIAPEEIRKEAWKEIEAVEAEKKRRESHREKVDTYKLDAIKLFKSKAPLAEKIAKLDEILAEKSRFLSPTEDEDSGRGGWYHLNKWIREQYGGGISEEVNRQRIQECYRIAVATGVYSLRFASADYSVRDYLAQKRFSTIEGAMHLLRQTSGKYDPLSKDPFERSAYARLGTNSAPIQHYVRDAKGNWIEAPKPESKAQ